MIFELTENQQSACVKPKAQIICAVTAQLISAFVFATQLVEFLFYLNPKFQASSLLLCLYRQICVGPGWKYRILVVSCKDSFLARLHEVHRAIVVTLVVRVYGYVYAYVRVTLSVKVF